MRIHVRVAAAGLAVACLVAVSACGSSSDRDGAKEKASESASASASSASASTSSSKSPKPGGSHSHDSHPKPKTTSGAISRYEEYLHAVGNGQVNKMCTIAKPAMESAGGTCESNFNSMMKMYSPEQLDALKHATVSKSKVKAKSGHEVYVPTAAVKADAKFTDDNLGAATLKFQDGNWFITHQDRPQAGR